MNTPLVTHFRLSSALCLDSDDDIEYMSRVSFLVQLVLLCMLWFVLILIYLTHYMWSVDSWIISVRSIRELFSGFLDICKVHLMSDWNLENLEMGLLVMLILIMSVIWIRGCLSKIMFSSLLVMLLAKK